MVSRTWQNLANCVVRVDSKAVLVSSIISSMARYKSGEFLPTDPLSDCDLGLVKEKHDI